MLHGTDHARFEDYVAVDNLLIGRYAPHLQKSGLLQYHRLLLLKEVPIAYDSIADKPLAYVAPAKALATMAVDMLWDGAAGARDVLTNAKPRLTREAYLALQRGMAKREVYEGGAGQ